MFHIISFLLFLFYLTFLFFSFIALFCFCCVLLPYCTTIFHNIQSTVIRDFSSALHTHIFFYIHLFLVYKFFSSAFFFLPLYVIDQLVFALPPSVLSLHIYFSSSSGSAIISHPVYVADLHIVYTAPTSLRSYFTYSATFVYTYLCQALCSTLLCLCACLFVCVYVFASILSGMWFLMPLYPLSCH